MMVEAVHTMPAKEIKHSSTGPVDVRKRRWAIAQDKVRGPTGAYVVQSPEMSIVGAHSIRGAAALRT